MDLRTKFVQSYNAGKAVSVQFVKKDGTIRNMVCQRDAALEAEVQGVVVHANPDVKRVIELLPCGRKRWRSVNLDAIVKVG